VRIAKALPGSARASHLGGEPLFWATNHLAQARVSRLSENSWRTCVFSA